MLHIAFLCIVLGVFPSLGGAAEKTLESKPYNIVLIAIDGLRADHMGCYGYKRNTSPRMDEIAGKAILFKQAVAQTSWTLPSFASLFTSEYVQTHGVFHMGCKLGNEKLLLSEILQKHGYRTAGFVGGPFLEPKFGFAQGYDVYRARGTRHFRDTMPPAMEWLKNNKDKRFFLFVHGNDVHPPFNQPNMAGPVKLQFDKDYKGRADEMLLDYYFVRVYNRIPISPTEPQPDESYKAKVDAIRKNPRDLEHIIAHHDGQVVNADKWVGEMWKLMKELDLLKNTIVIITADHGLEWGEKGLLATGYHPTLWETITHVPLILWHPAAGHAEISQVVQLIDLAPTLLDMMGIPIPVEFQGVNLTPLVAGIPSSLDKRYAFSASSIVSPQERIKMFMIRDSRWKLIYNEETDESGLFDLKKDPGELNDLIKKKPEKALDLSQRLFKHIRITTERKLPEKSMEHLTPDLLKKLREAGYW